MIGEEMLIWRGNLTPGYRMVISSTPDLVLELPVIQVAGLAIQLKCDFKLIHLETDLVIKMIKLHSHKFSHVGYDGASMKLYLLDKSGPQLMRYEKVPERIYHQLKRAESAKRFYQKHISRSYHQTQLN